MTNKLVVIINSLKLPKIKKILLHKMKFLVPNYSCFQNPSLERATTPRSPFSLSSVLKWICWTPHEQNSWVRHCMGLYNVYIKSWNRHQEWVHQNKDMVSYQYMSWNCFLGTPQRCADPCKWCYHCKQYQLHTRQLLIPTSVRSSLSTFLHGTIVLRVCSQMLSVLLSDAARFVSSTNKYRDFVNIDECATVRGHQLRKQADTTF